MILVTWDTCCESAWSEVEANKLLHNRGDFSTLSYSKDIDLSLGLNRLSFLSSKLGELSNSLLNVDGLFGDVQRVPLSSCNISEHTISLKKMFILFKQNKSLKKKKKLNRQDIVLPETKVLDTCCWVRLERRPWI